MIPLRLIDLEAIPKSNANVCASPVIAATPGIGNDGTVLLVVIETVSHFKPILFVSQVLSTWSPVRALVLIYIPCAVHHQNYLIVYYYLFGYNSISLPYLSSSRC